MNRKKRIQILLIENLKNCECQIYDNSADHQGHNQFDGTQESHFLIIIKPKKKLNIKKITLHRKINELLKYEFQNGLHSLEIKIIDPV